MARATRRLPISAATLLTFLTVGALAPLAQPGPEATGEANLKLPDLSQVFFMGVDGHRLLTFGLGFCVLGLVFGLVMYMSLKNLPVHRAMREISELIYETCKTYLITQGKFILILEAFIAVIILLYFGLLLHYEAARVAIILAFSLVGSRAGGRVRAGEAGRARARAGSTAFCGGGGVGRARCGGWAGGVGGEWPAGRRRGARAHEGALGAEAGAELERAGTLSAQQRVR